MSEDHEPLSFTSVDVGPDVGRRQAAHTRLLAALQSLPSNWQRVLWYADVLQEPPGRVGPLMGIPAKDVPALVRRARDGLREAYVVATAES